MNKLFFLCPGGMNPGESPSEHLAKMVGELGDWQIDMWNMNSQGSPLNINLSSYSLIWGDMDGKQVPVVAISLARRWRLPCYIHGEWIPPYRIEPGWEEEFNEKTQLGFRNYYAHNALAMQEADLVSLGIGEDMAGGRRWICEKFNVKFENYFTRYPACRKYPMFKMQRRRQVATIARVNDGKKRVAHTLKALELLDNSPTFRVLGGTVRSDKVPVINDGIWNRPEKVRLFSESAVAVQHWSGIPPAEAIQQLCPVISYDIPVMRDLYGDALIWVKKDSIEKLSDTISYWVENREAREAKAAETKRRFKNGEYNVKLETARAKLVISKIKELM